MTMEDIRAAVARRGRDGNGFRGEASSPFNPHVEPQHYPSSANDPRAARPLSSN